MIDYSKVEVGDILKLTGVGAPGYAKLGDLLRVTSKTVSGVKVEDKNGEACEFVFNCGAARLETTEWKDDFPHDLDQENSETKPSVTAEMPRYKCHKEVYALKIKRVELGVTDKENWKTTGGAHLLHVSDGFEPLVVDNAYMRKHNPQPGGYFVIYADGYQSFSPAEAFEAGYTRL
jgi:hypothetical protein